MSVLLLAIPILFHMPRWLVRLGYLPPLLPGAGIRTVWVLFCAMAMAAAVVRQCNGKAEKQR